MNTATGRFWTMDSYEGRITEPMSLHKYLYGHGNPANNIDPSGHITLLGTLAAAAVIGTIGSIAFTVAAWAVDAFGLPGGDRLEGLARIFNGIAFIGYSPAFGPAFPLALLAGVDEIIAGADQVWNGGRRDSPITKFLISIGVSPSSARISVGIAKFVLAIGPQTLSAIKRVITEAKNLTANGGFRSLMSAIWNNDDRLATVGKEVYEMIEGLTPEQQIDVMNWLGGGLRNFAPGQSLNTIPTGLTALADAIGGVFRAGQNPCIPPRTGKIARVSGGRPPWTHQSFPTGRTAGSPFFGWERF